MDNILPADSAFVSGTLQLPLYGTPGPGPAAHGIAAYDILVILSAILFILNIRKFINIIPYLIGSLFRWKESINIEDSMKINRSRDAVCLILAVPFCLMASKYRFWPEISLHGWSANTELAVTAGISAAYVALRMVCNFAGHFIKGSRKTFQIASKVSRTFFCTGTIIMLAVCWSMSLMGVEGTVIREAALYAAGAVYLIFLLRKAQIFINSCSLLSTILYLCTLEIVPTATLIAAAVLI